MYKEWEWGGFGAFHTWAPVTFHTGAAACRTGYAIDGQRKERGVGEERKGRRQAHVANRRDQLRIGREKGGSGGVGVAGHGAEVGCAGGLARR